MTGRAEAERRRRVETVGAALVIASVAVVIAVGARAGGGAAGRGDGRPGRDADVVARVPARALDSAAAERAALARQLARAPRDVEQAVRLARLDVAAARASADPRFLGRAERSLSPWWDADRPPADVRLLRATIRQSRHEFDAALADLDRLVEERPDDAQAWLTRAVVLGVRGRYREALASCDPLTPLASRFAVVACRAPLLGTTGRLDGARAALAAALRDAASPPERAWGLSLLGELSAWAADAAAAEAQLRAALDIAPNDRYTRGALADLLMDQGRPGDAEAIVAGHTQDDGLLLRQAIARMTAGLADADAAAAELRARLAASRRRGDTVHLREEARAALEIDRDGPRALALAARNWEVQHEPADARVLLEAAAATGDRAAAAPVLAWLDETGFEWPALRSLAATVRGGS